jgi:hypothetical protein
MIRCARRWQNTDGYHVTCVLRRGHGGTYCIDAASESVRTELTFPAADVLALMERLGW